MSFDGRYLHTFWVVWRERGFGRAARRLHRSQPTVSYQVKQLEEQLGTPLIERSPRGIALTEAGQRLYAFCDPFFTGWDRVQGELGDAPRLRLVSVAGFGRYVLYPLLAERLGDQRFELRLPTAEQVFERVSFGAAELGFVYCAPSDEALASAPVWTEELVLIRGRGMPEELGERAPFVTYDEHEYVFARYFEGLERRPEVDSVHHFEDLEEVVGAVARGAGWSVVPSFCVPMGREVQVVRLRATPCLNEIHAVYLQGHLRPAASALLDGLRALAAR
jgi:LysR family cyn operon transcriptional activator